MDQVLVIPKLLNDNECKQFIDYFENNKSTGIHEKSRHAVTDEVTEGTFLSVEIPKDENLQKLAFDKTEIAINKWVNHLDSFNSFNMAILKERLNFAHKFRILRYEEGQSIHPHTDFVEYSYSSCTLNLNDDYTGGEFSFFNQKYNIALGKGDCLIFPNNLFWVHEVLKIQSGVRYSVNSFIISIPYEKQLISNYWAIPFLEIKTDKFSIN